MKIVHGLQLAVISTLVCASLCPAQNTSTDGVRLYAMDCGHFDFKNLTPFSDTGEYDGKPGPLADPCFLIHDPKGWLLWDTGLTDKLVGSPQDGALPGSRMSRERSLASELKQLGLTPGDITYVSFSHLHADHAGNANLFGSSIWLLQEKELAYATSTPAPRGIDPSTFSDYPRVQKKLLNGDYDVFGDGLVRILSTPGHTPGHQVLLVKLPSKGYVILTGDLYHLEQSRDERLVPVFNTSRAETLASIDRVERLAKNLRATVVVQHATEDFGKLPQFPDYWQ
jgi:N-acyl homoserine lactone hydrolase